MFLSVLKNVTPKLETLTLKLIILFVVVVAVLLPLLVLLVSIAVAVDDVAAAVIDIVVAVVVVVDVVFAAAVIAVVGGGIGIVIVQDVFATSTLDDVFVVTSVLAFVLSLCRACTDADNIISSLMLLSPSLLLLETQLATISCGYSVSKLHLHF